MLRVGNGDSQVPGTNQAGGLVKNLEPPVAWSKQVSFRGYIEARWCQGLLFAQSKGRFRGKKRGWRVPLQDFCA